MASARGPGCAKSLLLWAFARVAFAPTAYPHLGIHTGEDLTAARPPPNALPLSRATRRLSGPSRKWGAACYRREQAFVARGLL